MIHRKGTCVHTPPVTCSAFHLTYLSNLCLKLIYTALTKAQKKKSSKYSLPWGASHSHSFLKHVNQASLSGKRAKKFHTGTSGSKFHRICPSLAFKASTVVLTIGDSWIAFECNSWKSTEIPGGISRQIRFFVDNGIPKSHYDGVISKWPDFWTINRMRIEKLLATPRIIAPILMSPRWWCFLKTIVSLYNEPCLREGKTVASKLLFKMCGVYHI